MGKPHIEVDVQGGLQNLSSSQVGSSLPAANHLDQKKSIRKKRFPETRKGLEQLSSFQ